MLDSNESKAAHEPVKEAGAPEHDDVHSAVPTENNPPFSGLALLQEGKNLPGAFKSALLSKEFPKLTDANDQKVDQKAKQEHPGETLFSAEKISKIEKISITKDGIKSQETVQLKDGEPLPKGDYKIFWKIGKDPKTGQDVERAALLHIPEGKNLGLMILTPGASNKDQLSENYLMETHLHQLADTGDEKYAVLTLLTEKREIGSESKAKGIKSSAWVAHGVFLHKDVVDQLIQENKERTGIAYDDRDYVAGVLKTCSKLAPIDKDPQSRVFVGGSQGGAFITRLCGDERFQNMPNVDIVGSSAEASGKELNLPKDDYQVEPYKIIDKNGLHVQIFLHRNDTIALPHPDKLAMIKAAANVAFLHNKVVDLGLAAFDNLHQNPLKLESIYLRSLDQTISRHLGKSDQYTMKAYTPTNASEKLKTRKSFDRELKSDQEIKEARDKGKELLYIYSLKNKAGDTITADVYDLPINHVIAGKGDGSTSMYKKSDTIDESQIIDDNMEMLLKRRKTKK